MRKAPAAPSRPTKTVGRVAVPSIGRGLPSGIGQFVYDTRSEFRKIVWPTREETRNLTLLVIGVSLAVGAFVGVIDLVFNRFFQLLVGGA